MESFTNESESEGTVSVPKPFIKRQASTSIPGFDVSLNESTLNNAQLNKSDTTSTISVPKKNSLFEKARKSAQHNFSVNFDESNMNSETESSITVNFLKPKPPFKRKAVVNTSKITTNQFDVTFNETNNDLVSDPTDKTLSKLSQEDFSKVKVFEKPANNTIKDAFNLEYEESDLGENSEVTSTLTTSRCLFRLPANSSQNFEVSFSPTLPQIVSSSSSFSSQEEMLQNESRVDSDSEVNNAQESCQNRDVESSNQSFINNRETRIKSVNNNDSEMNATGKNHHGTGVGSSNDSIINTQESKNESTINNNSEVNAADVDSFNQSFINNQELRHESVINSDSEMTAANENFHGANVEYFKESFTNNRSNRSETYLDQSSVNDENLNNWMSDHSDEEIQPPTVPIIRRNASLIEEVPQTVKPVSPAQTSAMTWEQKFNEIISKSKKKNQLQECNLLNLGKMSKTKAISKQKKDKEQRHEKTEQAKSSKLLKPAYFANKRLYQYIIKKLEPKFGIDTILQSEQIVSSICDTVKKVERRKSYQKKLIQDLKKEMASVGLIETTVDFYNFVINFLPYTFREKVVPCLQPITNTVFPPKDTVNPFDKILLD